MYAIIETGGKQLKVEAGDTILMELVDETKEIKARIVKPIVALNE